MSDSLFKDRKKLHLTEEEDIIFSGVSDDLNEKRSKILMRKMLTCRRSIRKC